MKETKRRSQLLLTIEMVLFYYVQLVDDNTLNCIYNKILNHDSFSVCLFVS